MLKYFRRQKYSLISIHHCPNSICVLQLKRDGFTYRIQDCRLHVHPQSLPTDEDWSNILLDLLAEMKIKDRYAAIAIEDALAITKVIEVKTALKGAYKQAEIRLQAQHLTPYPLAELYFDFIDIQPAPSNRKLTSILFVAVRRDPIDKRIVLMNKAGLKLRFIDLQSFSILRICHLLNEQRCNASLEQTIAFIEINNEKLTMKVLNNFALVFTHESLVPDCLKSGEETDDALSHQNKLSFPPEQAGLVKTIVALIHHALDSYYASPVYYKPNVLILTGDPTVLSDRLVQSVQSEFTIPCYLSNPFIKINFAELIEMKLLKIYARHLSICCGLALAMGKKFTSVPFGR